MLDFRSSPSLKLTFSPLKMDGWKTTYFPFGANGPFSGAVAVSFRKGIYNSCKKKQPSPGNSAGDLFEMVSSRDPF